MPGQVVIQTLAGAAQFDGLTNSTGLFVFSNFDNQPKSTRVVLTAISYATATVIAPGDIAFFLQLPGGAATERILLGRGLQADITGPAGDGDFSVCGKVVPRNNDGTNWTLHAVTTNKNANASVVVDFILQPFPDTSDRDSAAP